VLRRVRRALSLADSPIGRGLSRPVTIAMAVIAALVIAHDLDWFSTGHHWGALRLGTGAAATCIFIYFARNNLDAIGVRLRPLPSLRYWVLALVAIAAIFAVLVIVATIVYLHLDLEVQPRLPSSFDYVWNMVVDAPFVEEAIYRWVLVTAIAALGGRWLAVLISGAIFAYLHFLYGNPGPDNFIGGYFFAWMYLRSGSILTPIAFHAIGNGSLIVLDVIAYYVMA
jgi:uncharacterized protein